MSEIMISVEHATKKFREITALSDVTIEFEKNKIHGIIGRNGSGKTVLIKSICGLLRLTQGRVVVDNKVIGKDVQIPDNIGVIIETPGFYGNFSGYDNLKYLADIKGRVGKEEIRQVMNRVGLDPDMKRWVGKYSLGMRQRLGIAQAIMENPDILILDEPTNGLDKRGVEEFRELMMSFREEGKTILLASHSAEDIELLCDSVYELENGKLAG